MSLVSCFVGVHHNYAITLYTNCIRNIGIVGGIRCKILLNKEGSFGVGSKKKKKMGFLLLAPKNGGHSYPDSKLCLMVESGPVGCGSRIKAGKITDKAIET